MEENYGGGQGLNWAVEPRREIVMERAVTPFRKLFLRRAQAETAFRNFPLASI
jgi:hypothetical protein